MKDSDKAILDHLVHASESLQAAFELAAESGREPALKALLRRSGILVAGSIDALIRPIGVAPGRVVS